RLMIGSVVACIAGAGQAHAQLNTQHIKGTVGLKGGSQPPPNIYVIAPLAYVYNTDDVRDRNGDQVQRIGAKITSVAWAAGVSVVTSKKILGGNYGFQILFPVGVNNRLQGTEIDANPGGGLSDSGLVPISLGWHFTRANVMTS